MILETRATRPAPDLNPETGRPWPHTPVDLSITATVRQGAAVLLADLTGTTTGRDVTPLLRTLVTTDTLTDSPVERVMRDLAQDALWEAEDAARAADYRRTVAHVPATQTNTRGVPDPSTRKDGRNIAAAFLARRVR